MRKFIILLTILSFTVLAQGQDFTWASVKHADSSILRNMPAGKVAVYNIDQDSGYVIISGYPSGTTLATIIAAGNASVIGGGDGGASALWSEGTGVQYPTTLTNSVGIGTNSPDSALHVADGGAIFETDIVVGGGWKAYTPDLTWTNGSPTGLTTVGRYNVVNDEVTFNVTISGSNNSTTVTMLFVSCPVEVKDVNQFPVMSCLYDDNAAELDNSMYLRCFIDADGPVAAGRQIYTGTFSIPNGNSFMISISGSYER